jgi:uncharacterized ubiquitin-like protein YukD
VKARLKISEEFFGYNDGQIDMEVSILLPAGSQVEILQQSKDGLTCLVRYENWVKTMSKSRLDLGFKAEYRSN